MLSYAESPCLFSSSRCTWSLCFKPPDVRVVPTLFPRQQHSGLSAVDSFPFLPACQQPKPGHHRHPCVYSRQYPIIATPHATFSLHPASSHLRCPSFSRSTLRAGPSLSSRSPLTSPPPRCRRSSVIVTLENIGRLFDSYKASALSAAAKDFCRLRGCPTSARVYVELYSEEGSLAFAQEWASKMQLYMHHQRHGGLGRQISYRLVPGH